MSDNPYEKDCMYCRQKITMSKETGKCLPYNSDGSTHDCRNKSEEKFADTTISSKIDEKAILKTVLARLDGIRQDLEKLLA
jgi:hypothetical protein